MTENLAEFQKEFQKIERKTLFREYLTVIYGLVTTEGLLYFITEASHHRIAFWPSLPLFLGTFVQALHFWMTSVTADKTSDGMYKLLAEHKPRRRILLMLTDMLFSTGLVACILTMFLNIDGREEIFFRFFVVLAVASMAYDSCAAIISRLVRFPAERLKARPGAEKSLKEYQKLTLKWLGQDCYCFAACGLTYLWYLRSWQRTPIRISFLYLVLVTAFFVLDMLVIHWKRYKEELL